MRPCTKEEIVLLRKCCCPICLKTTLLEGPHGGEYVNVKCSRCGSEWNIAPLNTSCAQLKEGRVTCRICGSKEERVRNVNLYLIGSEGTDMCHSCEMEVLNVIRAMTRVAGIARKSGYMSARQQEAG
jgi:hypothetical protein